MIYHQSPYNQTLIFSSEFYYSISDEKLAEIEQNCANIDKEFINIGWSGKIEEIDTDTDNIPDIDFEK